MASSSKDAPRTKWQEFLDRPKGVLAYNPSETFALHVQWIVRSPAAAREMIARGLRPCAAATLRDSPTTALYAFRLARDQTPAARFKQEVATLGQHPHYQPAFKSLAMGVSRAGVEARLRNSGIDPRLLDWGADEPLAPHAAELDFDPVVVELTEVYMDAQAFYEHGASREWQAGHPEILKPARSLKPTTYCAGTATQDVWDRVLEPSLHAVRVPSGGALRAGVFFDRAAGGGAAPGSPVALMDLDLAVPSMHAEACRAAVDGLRGALDAPVLVVLLVNPDPDTPQEPAQVRITMSFPAALARAAEAAAALRRTRDLCAGAVDGRVVVFGAESEQGGAVSTVGAFLAEAGVEGRVAVARAGDMERDDTLAGYPLHPLYASLVADPAKQYTL